MLRKRGTRILIRSTLHLPADSDAFDPSKGPFVEAFQPGLLALAAGHTSLVALDAPIAACVAGIRDEVHRALC